MSLLDEVGGLFLFLYTNYLNIRHHNIDTSAFVAEDEFEWLGYFQHTKESLSTTHSSDSDLFPADAFPMEMKTS